MESTLFGDKQFKPTPFIKWVGGKRKLMNVLLKHIPKSFDCYYETCVGGGALFLELLSKGVIKKAYISDINTELITAYKIIRDKSEDLMIALDELKEQHSEIFYNEVKSVIPSYDVDIAARFIYLNKAGFNGLYRVSKKSGFNVGWGKVPKEKLMLYHKENIEQLSTGLKEISINNCSYNIAEPNAEDFIFIDPPHYGVFTSYNLEKFGEKQQLELYEYIKKLNNKKVKFLLSNSNSDFIKELYNEYNIIVVDVARSISCKASTRIGKEVLICNY